MKNDRWKQRITIYVFLFWLVGLTLLIVICPKETVSEAERRRLAEKPELTLDSVLDKSFMDNIEKYLLDHFPFRNAFRRVKAHFAYDVLLQKENNDIYTAGAHASKLDYELKETSVKRLAEKMAGLREKYFPNQMFCYAVVPDKNYFLARENGFPSMDYGRMVTLLTEEMERAGNARYIDILSCLSIDDYYHTDTHWRQERLFHTADTILGAFDIEDASGMQEADYQANEVKDFYGVYYGQAALPMEPDTIVYLTNEVTESASVWSLEENFHNGKVVLPDETAAVLMPVYRTDKLEDMMSVDKYDIYTGGASSLQVIRSPKAATDKRLVVFRDSYTSSLAPLLLGTYREITLIDLRYINSALIGEYVDFADADILFLYNTAIVNQSEMLK
ncbi:MAG: hypothetical protein K2N73_08860 [Lachnospiraceae bacterium]|nr:hypothetical protein [Lachnospiraceae bacterium]